MFVESNQFLGTEGQELNASAWVMPNGTEVLVCRAREGFALYTHPEWSNSTVPSYGADPEGRVQLHGRYVEPQDPAWVVPSEVRAKAVS